MKKILIGAALIALMPAAYAQDVEIFGQSYSLILVIPLILILVLLVGFAGMIAFDVIRRRKKLRQKAAEEEAEEKKPSREAVEAPAKKDMPPKKEALKKREEMIMGYLREIKALGKSLPGMGADSGFDALNSLIHRFFSEFFDIRYKFTYEELEKELKKMQQEVVFSAESLSKLHYGPVNLTKSEVQDLFYEFQEIVDTLVKGERLAEKEKSLKRGMNIVKSFLKLVDLKVAGKRIEKQKEIEQRQMAVEQKLPAKAYAAKSKGPSELELLVKKRLQILHDLIREGMEMAAEDANMANDIYRKLYEHYHNLSVMEKRELYPYVIEFYKAIKEHLG